MEGLLRAFLDHLEHDPAAVQLASEGGTAFVSQSLRPFVVAALADQDARRPALVVVGDDRAARDLANDLKAWLAPRPVPYYPSRGVASESPPPPPRPLPPEPRRRLRVAPHAAAAPRRPARRRAGRADGHARGLRAARRRDLRHRAEREGARPEAAPARLRPQRRRPAGPRGDRAAARRRGLP